MTSSKIQVILIIRNRVEYPSFLGANRIVQPQIYLAADHGIDPALIDPDALFVLEKLRNAGFIAYLVGGSVRDLLIQKVPKDCDISTSALPEQIKSIFQRQCILIGKRFRLAHIRFGHKIIEVSTFRTGENDSDLIIRDNQWGTPEQDVLRRDFTINGLYYDSFNHSIIDYVGGCDDVKKGILRTIGSPEVRFKQDPVRLLRLLKFQARLKFQIETETEKAAHQCKNEIVKSSSARVLEEFLRMLESGSSAAFIRLLNQFNILSILLPDLSSFLRSNEGNTVYHYLSCADQIFHHKGKNLLDRAVLASCLVYPMVERAIQREYLDKQMVPHIGQITMLATTLVRSIFVSAFHQFPRRLSAIIISVLVAQFRLTPLSGKRHYREKLFHYKDFKLALNFLKLRALVSEDLVDTYTSIRNQYRQIVHHGDRKHVHHKHAHTP